MKMSTGLKRDIYESLTKTIKLYSHEEDEFVDTVNSSYDGIMKVLNVINPNFHERIINE